MVQTTKKSLPSPEPVDFLIEGLRDLGIDPLEVGRVKMKGLDPEEWPRFGARDVFAELWTLNLVFAELRITIKANMIPSPIKSAIIARTVLHFLIFSGKFLYDESQRACYYFHADRKCVFAFDSTLRAYIEIEFGLRREQESKETLAVLESYCIESGERIRIHQVAYFDRDEKCLYLYDRYQNIFRISNAIEMIPNGTEGVYFSNVEQGARQIILKHDPKVTVADVIVNRVSFEPTPALTIQQQRLLLKIYLYTVVFAEIIDTKPILAIVGEKGSGKTALFRMIGRFLVGERFGVQPPPNKEDDFWAAVCGRFLCYLDNVDRFSKWMENALATAASGGYIVKRKLYTDFDQTGMDAKAFIGVNSRDPYFKRDDVADRLIILHVTRPNEFLSENQLYKTIETNIDEIWTAYINDLHKILEHIQKVDFDSIVTTHRLAGWTIMAEIINEALQICPRAELMDALESLQNERYLFALSISPLLIEGIEKLYCAGPRQELFDPLFDRQGIPAGDLLKKLCEINPAIEAEIKTPQKLGSRISRLLNEIQSIGIPLVKNYDSNKKVWKYGFDAGMRVSNLVLSSVRDAREEENKFTIENTQLNTRIPAVFELIKKQHAFSPGDWIRMCEQYEIPEADARRYMDERKAEGIIRASTVGRLVVIDIPDGSPPSILKAVEDEIDCLGFESNDSSFSRAKLYDRCATRKITEKQFSEAIDYLLMHGIIYQPREGVLKRIGT